MRKPKRPRRFTNEFKRRIVGLHNAGKPKREIMEECDLGKNTVERWIKSVIKLCISVASRPRGAPTSSHSPESTEFHTPDSNSILL